MSTKPSKILSVLTWTALSLAGAYLILRYFLPWTAPFLLAAAFAAVLELPVGKLCKHWRWPRAAASGVCTLCFIALALGLIWLLCSRLLSELSALSQHFPRLLSELSATLMSWQSSIGHWFDSSPAGLKLWLERVSDGFYSFLAALPAQLSQRLLSVLTAFASAAPSALLFFVTVLIGMYFISASYPEIMSFIRRQIPPHLRSRASLLYRQLRSTLGKWLRAQLIMMFITFIELALAFALLGVNYAFVLAVLTAVIDALPVLGAGTVLLPWSLYCFLTGNVSLGIGLAVTYGAVTLLRNCIQAKLLGDQLGLHPVATLLAIYVGWKAWGVMGMIIFPIAAISLVQLNSAGIIHLWKTEKEGDAYGRNNFQYHSRHGNEHTGRHEYPSG